MKSLVFGAAGLVCLAGMLVQTAQANTMGANTPAGTAYAGACGGWGPWGGGYWPGDQFNNGVTQNNIYGVVNCNTLSSAVGGSTGWITASASGSYNGGGAGTWPYDENAQAEASPGSVHLESSNTASSNVQFPGATAQGGWNDQYKICTVSTCNPVSGDWVVPIWVDGTITTTGPSGWGQMWVAAYMNGDNLIAGDSVFNSLNTRDNGDILTSFTAQAVAFGADRGGSYTVGRMVYFAVPVTLGTPFEFGVFMQAEASEAAFGYNPTTPGDNVNVQFQNTLLWGGPGYFLPTGSTTPEAVTVTNTASGFDYNQSYIPEPGTMLLMGVGVGLLSLVRRIRR